MHRLCVNPVFQNRGIAKSALLHIENELKAISIHADWRKGKFYLMEKYF